MTEEQQVQRFEQEDPALYTQIQEQQLAAEQQIQQDPQHAAQIADQLEQTEVEELRQVDPQLAAEIQESEQSSVTPPSPAVIQQANERLEAEDPQLMATIRQQEQAATLEEEEYPQQAAEIREQLGQEIVQEIEPVDPQVAEIAAEEAAAENQQGPVRAPETPEQARAADQQEQYVVQAQQEVEAERLAEEQQEEESFDQNLRDS
jgi:hypothetical protein